MIEKVPQKMLLVPYPQSLIETGTTITLADSRLITLAGAPAADLWFTAQQAQRAISECARLSWVIVGGSSVPKESVGLTIIVNEAVAHAEGYQLTIAAAGVSLLAHDLAGAFYGVMTLSQLLQQFGANLPGVVIKDTPDFPSRGVMLDISRDKVPTMETLYGLIDQFASWKVNQLQLYTEHTFAYRNHAEVWAKASPITADEALALDAYCRERYIDLVPNQNSFGHMNRWFEHSRYKPLAEVEQGFMTPRGEWRDYQFTINPAHPDTLPFIEGLYDELLPNFSSQYFNVGCDETWDLGQGQSKALIEQKGVGQVYLDFVLEIYTRVKRRKLTMQFWGDIIGHYPDLVSQLPQDAIALEWGYESDHPFDTQCALFAASGIPFFVCPGTSSWQSIAGRTDNAIGNIRSAAENGLKYGASGLLNTDWGDRGHWQTLPVSYLGFVYGAALGWNTHGNVEMDLAAALNGLVFKDRANVMGKLAYDLGNIYQRPGVKIHNANILFSAYQYPLDLLHSDLDAFRTKQRDQLTATPDLAARTKETISAIDAIMLPLDSVQMDRPDADTIKAEFRLAARMLKHGALRLLVILGDPSGDQASLGSDLADIETEYRARWLARNRPGGLDDSMSVMRKIETEYA